MLTPQAVGVKRKVTPLRRVRPRSDRKTAGTVTVPAPEVRRERPTG